MVSSRTKTDVLEDWTEQSRRMKTQRSSTAGPVVLQTGADEV